MVVRTVGAGRAVARALRGVCRGSKSGVLYDSLTAAVVAAFAANGVVDVPVAAVGAKSQCGFYSLVVGATLCGAGFGLSAFRMCHFSLRCDIVIIIVSVLLRGVGLSAASLRKSCQADGGAGDSSRGCLSVVVFVFVSVTAALGVEVAQGRPTGVGGQGCLLFAFAGIVVVDAVHQVVLQLGVLVVFRGHAVLAQQGRHLTVALAQRVHVLDGHGQRHGVVNHVRHVELVHVRGYLDKLVRVVGKGVAVSYLDVVSGVDGPGHLLKAAVALHGDLAGDVEGDVVDVAVVFYLDVAFECRVVDGAALHVFEELLVGDELEVVGAFGERLEGKGEFGEFAHFADEKKELRGVVSCGVSGPSAAVVTPGKTLAETDTEKATRKSPCGAPR